MPPDFRRKIFHGVNFDHSIARELGRLLCCGGFCRCHAASHGSQGGRIFARLVRTRDSDSDLGREGAHVRALGVLLQFLRGGKLLHMRSRRAVDVQVDISTSSPGRLLYRALCTSSQHQDDAVEVSPLGEAVRHLELPVARCVDRHLRNLAVMDNVHERSRSPALDAEGFPLDPSVYTAANAICTRRRRRRSPHRGTDAT